MAPCGVTLIFLTAASACSHILNLPYEEGGNSTLGFMIDCSLLLGQLWALATDHPAHEGWLASAPAGRNLFIIMYFYAALSKVNSSFTDVRKSSVTYLAMESLETLLPEHWLQKVFTFSDTVLLNFFRMLLWMVVVIEWLIPVLLSAGFIYEGLVLDWLFQISLLVPGWDYAVLMIANLVQFAPPENLLWLSWFTIPLMAKVAAVCLMAVICNLKVPGHSPGSGLWHYAILIAWCCCLSPLAYMDIDAVPQGSLFSLTSPRGMMIANCIICAIAVANGALYYLGVKTKWCWTMVSNLQIEAETNNHSWIPSIQLPGARTRDLVTIFDTNATSLVGRLFQSNYQDGKGLFSEFAKRTNMELTLCVELYTCGQEPRLLFSPVQMPFFQLRTLIAMEEIKKASWDFFVEYEHQGVRKKFEYKDGKVVDGSDLKLIQPVPLLEFKFLSFRVIPAGTNGVCHADTGASYLAFGGYHSGYK
eukprot:gnl/MRDRNA2_/MRDRNA2_75048_c0_seq2.p1 gnl/MRDRNA2_/MRDRNA2_75048_c0~~gnl/MRDRNA2_/MRDRNA2_75048_c0_seq2.p1  ORF type:complete len:475 (+),score=56.52 gnl/MRDRNA2_/MRDRNA2_75048_c0_seq2:3-1427(+)